MRQSFRSSGQDVLLLGDKTVDIEAIAPVGHRGRNDPAGHGKLLFLAIPAARIDRPAGRGGNNLLGRLHSDRLRSYQVSLGLRQFPRVGRELGRTGQPVDTMRRQDRDHRDQQQHG